MNQSILIQGHFYHSYKTFRLCFVNQISEHIFRKMKTRKKLQKNLSFLALGDSYTIGEGVPESERWPNQLIRELRNSEYLIDDPVILARTGWTTAELAAALAQKPLTRPFTGVSLLIGVNNQYRGESVKTYETEFDNLLKKAVELAENHHNHVMVLSIPDWGVTPFASGKNPVRIRREIDTFNSVNREITRKSGAQYIDITDISREAGNDSSLLAPDDLHPSGKMYHLWVQRVLPVIEMIFQEELDGKRR
jgi:lysophospholipase L1-like esterase